jgi:hypothetical protein
MLGRGFYSLTWVLCLVAFPELRIPEPGLPPTLASRHVPALVTYRVASYLDLPRYFRTRAEKLPH